MYFAGFFGEFCWCSASAGPSAVPHVRNLTTSNNPWGSNPPPPICKHGARMMGLDGILIVSKQACAPSKSQGVGAPHPFAKRCSQNEFWERFVELNARLHTGNSPPPFADTISQDEFCKGLVWPRSTLGRLIKKRGGWAPPFANTIVFKWDLFDLTANSTARF